MAAAVERQKIDQFPRWSETRSLDTDFGFDFDTDYGFDINDIGDTDNDVNDGDYENNHIDDDDNDGYDNKNNRDTGDSNNDAYDEDNIDDANNNYGNKYTNYILDQDFEDHNSQENNNDNNNDTGRDDDDDDDNDDDDDDNDNDGDFDVMNFFEGSWLPLFSFPFVSNRSISILASRAQLFLVITKPDKRGSRLEGLKLRRSFRVSNRFPFGSTLFSGREYNGFRHETIGMVVWAWDRVQR